MSCHRTSPETYVNIADQKLMCLELDIARTTSQTDIHLRGQHVSGNRANLQQTVNVTEVCMQTVAACLHEVLIVAQLPALPAQLQPVSHLQLALPVHDGNAPRDAVNAACHIPHHLLQKSMLTLCSLLHDVTLNSMQTHSRKLYQASKASRTGMVD